MLWGDFNKDGRVDLAFARQFSSDVWLNNTPADPTCRPVSGSRGLSLCTFGSPTGNFQFLSSPIDSQIINAVQIYVDGSLKFETPDDLLNTKIFLTGGMHRITAKGWDDLGPFSTTINLLACTNDVVRTVKICSPANGSSSGSAVHIVASAATSQAFSQLQVYIDGVVKFHTSAKYVDISLDLSVGTHHITVKGWDSSGAFSNAVNVTVR